MGVMSNILRIVFAAAWILIAEVGWAQEDRIHSVQRKETAYGIARHYGVDLNRLFELNRWAEGGIRKGDTLRIPSVAKEESEIAELLAVERAGWSDPPHYAALGGTAAVVAGVE